MPVTSNHIITAILTSINTALTKTDLQNDERASLINQYEQTTEMVREGYQFSEADIYDLPAQISSLADQALANSLANIQSQVDTQIQTLQDWKYDFSRVNTSPFEGLYDPMMPGTDTNFDELNELNVSLSNIVRQPVNFSSIDSTNQDVDIERFLAQVVRHQFRYNFFSTVGVIATCEWSVTQLSGYVRIDNQYTNKNFFGPHTWACWVRVPEGSTNHSASSLIVWQHPDAKNSDGTYNLNNWHLVGGFSSKVPAHSTIVFPNASNGVIEMFGYSRVAGHVPIENGSWFPIHQVGYKNSSSSVGGLYGQLG